MTALAYASPRPVLVGVPLALAGLLLGCSDGRDLNPPDRSTDHLGDTTLPDARDGWDATDPEEEEIVEPLVIRLIDSQIVGSNVMLFVSVTSAAGEAVVDLVQEDFVVLEDSAPISVESELDIQKRPTNSVWRTLILFDTSYSILSAYDLGTLIEPVRTYATSIVERATRADRVSIAAFDGAEEPRSVIHDSGLPPWPEAIYYTSLANKLECDLAEFLEVQCEVNADCEALDAARPTCAGGLCIDRSTDLYSSVIWGLADLEREIGQEKRVGIPRGGSLITFTDGSDRAGRTTLGNVIFNLDHLATPIHSFAVGLTGEVDTEALLAIGRDGTVFIDSLDDLDAALGEIGDLIEAIGNGLYLISYCTPARSERHEITVDLVQPANSVAWEFEASGEARCDPAAAASACVDMACGMGADSFHCGDCASGEVCRCTGCETICGRGVCGLVDVHPQCLGNAGICDGYCDCLYGTDEQVCTCGSGNFTCGDGACISNTRYCDGIEDCSDGTDEASCTCPTGEFACPRSVQMDCGCCPSGQTCVDNACVSI